MTSADGGCAAIGDAGPGGPDIAGSGVSVAGIGTAVAAAGISIAGAVLAAVELAAAASAVAGAVERKDERTSRGAGPMSGARWTIHISAGPERDAGLAGVWALGGSTAGAVGATAGRTAGTTGPPAGAGRDRRNASTTLRKGPADGSAGLEGSAGDGSACEDAGGTLDAWDLDAVRRLTAGRAVPRRASTDGPSSTVRNGSAAARRWTMTGVRRTATGSGADDVGTLSPAGAGTAAAVGPSGAAVDAASSPRSTRAWIQRRRFADMPSATALPGAMALPGAKPLPADTALPGAIVSAGATVDATGCGGNLSASAGAAPPLSRDDSRIAGGTSCAITRAAGVGVREMRVGLGRPGCRT